MFEVTFKAQHECPYLHFSRKHPDVRIVQWCNRRTDVLEVECGDIETFNRIEQDLQRLLLWKGARVLRKTFGEKNIQVITKTCRDTHIAPSISGTIERNSCLEIPPVVYHGGWETHKVMGFRENDFKKLFKDLSKLGAAEVLSKRVYEEKSMIDTFAVSLSAAFSDLTPKQAEAIATALELGYYQVPKKTTTEELALKQKVPRTTYEEHLRKAESKILRALSPYITLYARRPTRLQEVAPQLAE
jgi:predicted DNA binding protein